MDEWHLGKDKQGHIYRATFEVPKNWVFWSKHFEPKTFFIGWCQLVTLQFYVCTKNCCSLKQCTCKFQIKGLSRLRLCIWPAPRWKINFNQGFDQHKVVLVLWKTCKPLTHHCKISYFKLWKDKLKIQSQISRGVHNTRCDSDHNLPETQNWKLGTPSLFPVCTKYVWKLRWIFHKCGVHRTLSLPSGYNQELFCYNAFTLLLILRVVQTIILYGTSFFGQEGDSNTVLFWLPHGMQLQSVWTLKKNYHQLHMCSLFAVLGEDLVCEYSRLSAFLDTCCGKQLELGEMAVFAG